MQGKISKEKIKEYANLTCDRPELPQTIYHYTDTETADKILTDKGPSFRMSEMKDFADKLEGKTIEAYYDAALDRLERKGVISESDRMELGRIEMSKHYFPIKESESDIGLPMIVLKQDEARVFVACFSRNQMDAYMVDHYIKNESKAGYSIGIDSRYLQPVDNAIGMITDGIWKTIDVTYGEDAISYFENLLIELLTRSGGVGTDEYTKYVKGIIVNRLYERQYATKLGKFRQENEVRAILILPANHMQQLPDGITISREGERTYCYVRLGHYAVEGIYNTQSVSPQEDKERRAQWEKRHYHI